MTPSVYSKDRQSVLYLNEYIIIYLTSKLYKNLSQAFDGALKTPRIITCTGFHHPRINKIFQNGKETYYLEHILNI